MTLYNEGSDVQTQIIGCVDIALKHLGASVIRVIYFHLEKNYGIKKKDIPNRPEVFSKALYSIFGQGAKVVERLIVNEIQKRFKLNLIHKPAL